MAEDKIYRLLTLQQQLLSGNAIDKKAMRAFLRKNIIWNRTPLKNMIFKMQKNP